MPIGNQIQYTDNVASKIVSATATASQTTFNILDGYRVNAIAVYKQGLRLSNGVDFTATDGSTVVLTSGANLNDKMVFQIYDDFDVGDVSAAPGHFTVGGDLSVSGTLSGDGSGLTGVGSTEDVSCTTLNAVGVSTLTGVVNAGADVRVTGNINAGLGTLTTLYSNTLSNTDGYSYVSVLGGMTVNTGFVVSAGISTLGTTECDSLTVANAGSSFSGGAAANVSGAGIVTATSFVGALTGNATGLSGTPSITVQDITAEMVSIGGTLTYEDVTQIDSVGIITAQKDVRVGRNLNVTGVSTFSGSIGNVTVGIATATKFDGPGNIPAGQTGTVTLAASDAGKHVAATGTVTLGTGIFAVGDAVTIYNNSAGAITINVSAVTCYNAADASTTNRTLGARGLATILCTASNTYVISGAGLS